MGRGGVAGVCYLGPSDNHHLWRCEPVAGLLTSGIMLLAAYQRSFPLPRSHHTINFGKLCLHLPLNVSLHLEPKVVDGCRYLCRRSEGGRRRARWAPLSSSSWQRRTNPRPSCGSGWPYPWHCHTASWKILSFLVQHQLSEGILNLKQLLNAGDDMPKRVIHYTTPTCSGDGALAKSLCRMPWLQTKLTVIWPLRHIWRG